MRRLVISAVLLIATVAAAPVAHGAAESDCPAEKICLWNQPNFTGKMMIQQGGRCQRPPAQLNFGEIRSVKNRTTTKPDGGQWALRTWTADDCNCSRTCAEQWTAEIKAGQDRSDLNPGQQSFEAVFLEPDSR
jgi:hypothetical protein